MNTHVKQYDAKGRNADEDTIEIVTNFDKFKKHLEKYFGDVEETRKVEKTLQELTPVWFLPMEPSVLMFLALLL